ncbi:recombinase family protein [Agromyces soli]|uniref:Recombinase family protein n=1 Tax=Agromyces soli TaxID=659012 RepID=A0ABY4ARL1_9MICO|nr:recombinase family protein [Agromyces soli]UOE24826.1 recombinase family protein [Agromyces soli]
MRAVLTSECPIATTTALIYLRISANRTSEHASIEQQRADCTALAGRLGYTHTVEFVDEAVSAYQDRARPAYQQLLRQLEGSEAGTVVVWHLDRLYRKPRELEQLLDLLDTRPIRVESVQGGSFDLNQHEGRLFARQLVAFANYESAHKGARVARAQQHRARNRLLHGGSHYGYRSDGTLHPVESAVIRRVVDDNLLGLSPTVTARALNADRIAPPRTNRGWHATTLRSMLDSDRLHQRRRDHAAARYVTGAWERLLTPDESALVQVSLLVPRRDAARSSTSLLGGILRCQLCGKRMVTGVTSNGKRFYLCKTTTARCPSPCLPADDLDAETEATALARFSNTDYPNPPHPRDMLERARTARLQFTALAVDFGTGKLGHAEYLVKRQPLADDIDQVGRDLTAYNRARILALYPAELRRRWESLSFRRAVVCALLPFDLPTA